MSLHTPPRHRVSPPINSPFIKPFDSPSPDSQHFSREGIQISPRSDTTTSSPGGLSREGRLAGETSLDSLDVVDSPMALSDEMAEGLNDLRMEKRMKGRSFDTTTANALVQTFPSPPDVHPSLEELSPIQLPPSRVSPKSSEAPNINQSFLRSSQAGSTIFSDPAASTIAQPSKPSPRRNAPVPSTDKSFLRMSRTTFAFSDFAPSSGRNQSMSSTSERSQQDEEEEVMRPVPSGRTSYGTFGSHPRRRSAVPSTSTGSDPGGQPTQDEDNVAVSIRNGRNDEDSQSASSGQRRRPLSMSSTSDSSFSAPASNTSPLLHVVAISTPAHLPSPTQRRPSHKAPETDQAITSHLLKSSAVNEVRIVPYQRSSPTNLGSAVQLAPPTCGTPLKAGCVKEERSFSDSSESGYGAVRSTKHPQQGMKPSKLDQVLGEGAETARVLMEFDRRAIRDTVKQLAHKS